MNTLLFTSIIIILAGTILFIVEKRSFLTGLILIIGFLGITFYTLSTLSSKSDIANTLILLTVYGLIPILVVICAFLFIKNGRSMMKKEGRKLPNLLSLIIGIYIFIIIFLSYILIYYGNKLNVFTYMIIISIIVMSVYLGVMFISYLIYSYIYQVMPVRKNIDYIIVLGSGLIGDRVPPLLKSRLDKGIDIYKDQKDRGNLPKIIVSGGQGPDELVSEAYAMKKYLISQGINNEDIIAEDKSTTTYENMKFSKLIMDKSDNYNCIFVTNNYHVFRASIFARKVGLKANGVGAPTAFYFLPSALIREFIAILFIYKWLNIIIILLYLALVINSLLPINF
ncbi:YdcF family protein [Romboutsia sp. 1001713B170131_170501_G6]|uniref:YdcF family protein n=1 Tax=Romboutsia sp. 1001713B170131_170501_G6 TaxID=2787108 RepID=UPI0018AC4142|nr:YdcF family protein [Romboutsia sp. 1001713B170131_170501_G6]